MSERVKKKEDASRFYIDINDEQAKLIYRKLDDKILDLRHTFVPKEARGEGIGAELVSHALEYAREKGYKVIPTCSFVKSYVEKHPEFQDLVK